MPTKPKPEKSAKPKRAAPAVRAIIMKCVKEKIAAEGMNLRQAALAIGISQAALEKAFRDANFNSKTQAKLEAFFNGKAAIEPEELNADNVKSLGDLVDEADDHVDHSGRGADGSRWNKAGVCTNPKRHVLKLDGKPLFAMSIATAQAPSGSWRFGFDFKVTGDRAAQSIDPCALHPVSNAIEHRWQAIAAGVQNGEIFLRDNRATKKQLEAWINFGKKYGVAEVPKQKKLSPLEAAVARAEAAERRLRAFEARDKQEKRLAANVKECERDVDGAKEDLASRKKELEEANERLTEFVRAPVAGDVETGTQQTLVPEKPKGKVEPLVMPERDGAEAYAGKNPLSINPHPLDSPAHAQWIGGYMTKKWAGAEARAAITYALNWSTLTGALLDPAGLLPGEVTKVKAVSAVGYHWLVVDGWRPSERADATFALVQLVKKDDWRDLWQTKYGPPVPGVDHSLEAQTARVVGGQNCGRVVHLEGVAGDYVVAPQEAAMLLTVPPMATIAAAAATTVDAKARAANDDSAE